MTDLPKLKVASGCDGFYIIDERNAKVATVHYSREPDAERLARLFAAAPRMVEMLRRILDHAVKCPQCGNELAIITHKPDCALAALLAEVGENK